MDKLHEWKEKEHRKPLLLTGARQTGKTYILKQFGAEAYPRCHYFNFEKNSLLHTLFEQDFNPNRIIAQLSLFQEQPISAESDLIVFDEIQNCPKALASLKYFCEEAPGVNICAAGSLLGLHLGSMPFPVGKVEYLTLYPMTFEEALWNTENRLLITAYHEGLETGSLSPLAHKKLLDVLFAYYITGGMPEIVAATALGGQNIDQRQLESIRTFQNDLLRMYESDIAKHAGQMNSMHIVSVLHAIPRQLSLTQDLSTKRFSFCDAIPGKKGFGPLQGPITWLKVASLIHTVGIVNQALVPLESYTKDNMFKCFLFDTGLLGAMLDLPPAQLLLQDYGTAKGYYAENYVLQELAAAGLRVYTWKERNSEIEFLYQSREGTIVPMEVKSGNRTQAKSLKQYMLKYSPKKAVILSTRNMDISQERSTAYIPLYYAGKIPLLLER